MFTRKRDKLLPFMLTMTVLIGTAVGCSSNNNGNPTPAATAGQSQAPAATPTPKPTDAPKAEKIVFWHYLNDRNDLLKEMAADFQKQTGVEVDIQLFGGDGFKEKVIAAAQNNSLPDIMTYAGGPGDLAKLVETNSVMELGAETGDIIGKFPETIVKTFSYKDGNLFNVKKFGTYAIPMDTNNMQFIYNKALFAKAGVAGPPKTWEELLAAVDKLNVAKITPFATGIGSWVPGAMIAPYEFAYLGQDKLMNIKKGDEPLVGSGYEKALNIFADLQKHKAFAEGIATMDLPKAEQMFVNGEVAMIYDGSWAIGVFNQMNPAFKDYDAFMPPKPADASFAVKIPGGIGVPLVVSQNTKSKDATLKFMKFLVAKEQQIKYAEKSFNLPANSEASKSEGDMSPALRNFSLGMQHVYESAGAYPNGNVETAMVKGVQLIALGQSTPDKVLKQMDDALKKALKEKK